MAEIEKIQGDLVLSYLLEEAEGIVLYWMLVSVRLILIADS